MNPRCTVLLPMYNAMPYIADSIHSLLNQSNVDLIIYALDDGSTDGSPEFIDSLADIRIQLFRLQHRGLAATLNTGLSNVTTEYVARMDADDISAPDRFFKQIQFLDSHTDHVLVGGRIRYISKDGSRASWVINTPSDHEMIVKNMMKRINAIFHPAIMCKTEAMKSIQGYDARTFPAEDYDLYFRLAQIGKLSNLSDCVLDMRITADSIISTQFRSSLRQYKKAVEKYSGETRQTSAWYYYIDELSLLIYRRGMLYYLNRSVIIGMMLFFLSAAVNPVRTMRFILGRFRL